MSAFLSPQPPPRDGGRRSKQVALVLLGTDGVVGAVAVWDAWRRAPDGGSWPVPAPQPAPMPLSPDRTYANNDFVPGVGYYHAPYHAWYPFPFNYHDPARGYYAGGLWQLAPWALLAMRSQPTSAAVAKALAAQHQRDEEQRRRTGAVGFSPGARGFSSGFSSARPAAPAATHGPSIMRGGFGGSAHGASGS